MKMKYSWCKELKILVASSNGEIVGYLKMDDLPKGEVVLN
jgi:hypothetical protein